MAARRRWRVAIGALLLLSFALEAAALAEPAIRQRVRALRDWIPLVDDPARADSAWAGIAAAMPGYADSAQRGFGWYLMYSAAQALGHVDSMRIAAESSLVYSPKDPSGFRDLASYLGRAGHHLELAEAAALRTVETPGQPVGAGQRRADLQWLARIREIRGDLAAAIETYERSLTVTERPDDYSLRQLGRLYAGQGRRDEAIDRLTLGLSAYPVDSAAAAWSGRLLDSLLRARGRGDLEAVRARVARGRESAERKYWLGDYRADTPAPRSAFLAADTKGAIRLREQRGLTVVYAWATWCGPCRQSMPALQEWAARRRTRPVRVVTVNAEGAPLPDARARVEAFFAEKRLTLPVAYADSATAAAWKLDRFPTTLVLKDGRIVYRDHAAGVTEGLEAQLASLGSAARE